MTGSCGLFAVALLPRFDRSVRGRRGQSRSGGSGGTIRGRNRHGAAVPLPARHSVAVFWSFDTDFALLRAVREAARASFNDRAYHRRGKRSIPAAKRLRLARYAVRCDNQTAPELAAAAHARHQRRAGEQPTRTTLRGLFHYPFRPVAVDPAWLTSDVLLLARGIYEERAFDRMPILADALQDAGCTSEEMLNRLRHGLDHTRGCWVLDAILGKEVRRLRRREHSFVGRKDRSPSGALRSSRTRQCQRQARAALGRGAHIGAPAVHRAVAADGHERPCHRR